MLLRDILKAKGNKVFTVSADATLSEVVRELVRHNIGSLVVFNGDELVGIITERDILRTMADLADRLDDVPIKSRMTTDVLSGSPDDEVSKTMGLMTEKRIRHLPIVEDGRLAGMVSIGDVVKAQHDRLTMENQYLINYIQS